MITTLERDITKYVDEGKDEYKEVMMMHLFFFVICDFDIKYIQLLLLCY